MASSGVVPDTFSTRCLWSYWNRERRGLLQRPANNALVPAASSDVWMPYGADSTQAMRTVVGTAIYHEIEVMDFGKANVALSLASSASLRNAIGLDLFNNGSSNTLAVPYDVVGGYTGATRAVFRGYPPEGMHVFSHLTQFTSVTSVTWFATTASGMSAGMAGSIFG